MADDDNDRFRIADQGSQEYDNEGVQGTPSTGILPFGIWNHVALTWDADYARIWLNGESNRDIAFTPVEWVIDFDTHGSGIHTIFMIVDVRPPTRDQGVASTTRWPTTD